MGIVKTGDAARKLGPIGVGRKIIRFATIFDEERQFIIHEDLICANSDYFKSRFQKHRKALDGECSIRSEDLDPRKRDIIFCRTQCGQNFHYSCLMEWEGAQTGQFRCPICRKIWKNNLLDPEEDVVKIDDDVDTAAVQIYIDWLYSGQLRIDDTIARKDDAFNIKLLGAWKVSWVLEDDGFRHAIVAEYLSAIQAGENESFRIDSIDYAVEDEDIDSMREFVVDCLLTAVDEDWFLENQTQLPEDFKDMFILAALKRLKEKPSVGELLKLHTNGEYEMEEEARDEN